MAGELLRDVSGTDGASSHTHRHWSVLPLSIVVHGLAVAAILIIPLTAAVVPPPVAARWQGAAQVMPAVLPPAPPSPSAGAPPKPAEYRANTAPLEAPATIEPEWPAEADVPGPPGAIPGVPGGDPISSLLPFISGAAAPVAIPPPPPEKQAPVRPGGHIREPRRILDVRPEYPLIAQNARIEGVVILEAVIDTRGYVDDVRVLRSVPLLDDAAVNAVRRWRYTPTLLNGVPVPVLLTITVRFSLQK